MKSTHRWAVAAAVLSVTGLVAGSPAVRAAGTYDPGASDQEIVLGNIVPYSGPLSAAGAIGTCHQAYFAMVNDQGGINGRKVRVVSVDDGYNPARTLEQARRLVERDHVLLIYGTFGTATNSAIQEYLNRQKVPQMLITTGASKWNDPEKFPWTIGFLPSYRAEAEIYAKYILDSVKEPKIAILYLNDGYGKDYRDGLRAALGADAGRIIVAEQSYEVTDATVDQQMTQLKNSGANVFFNATAAKHAAQAVKRVNEIGWKPLHVLVNPASALGTVIRPAGIEASQGIVSAQFMKDPTSPDFQDHPDVKAWQAWKAKYNPNANDGDWWNWQCYATSYTLAHVLKQAGDDLRRQTVMKIVANLQGLEVPMLLNGVKVSTSAKDFAPLKQMQLMRLAGERWELFGGVVSAGPAAGQ